MYRLCSNCSYWLLSRIERVGQLYAGESLFGYVDLLQEERLHHSKGFSPPELKWVRFHVIEYLRRKNFCFVIKNGQRFMYVRCVLSCLVLFGWRWLFLWMCRKVLQEPCVVFAAHHSLRMGPAAHLLQCWRQNPLCLLILTEVLIFSLILLVSAFLTSFLLWSRNVFR